MKYRVLNVFCDEKIKAERSTKRTLEKYLRREREKKNPRRSNFFVNSRSDVERTHLVHRPLSFTFLEGKFLVFIRNELLPQRVKRFDDKDTWKWRERARSRGKESGSNAPSRCFFRFLPATSEEREGALLTEVEKTTQLIIRVSKASAKEFYSWRAYSSQLV